MIVPMSHDTHLNILYSIFNLKIVCNLTVYFIAFIKNSSANSQTQQVIFHTNIITKTVTAMSKSNKTGLADGPNAVNYFRGDKISLHFAIVNERKVWWIAPISIKNFTFHMTDLIKKQVACVSSRFVDHVEYFTKTDAIRDRIADCL